jgi:hypothetical protein
MIIDCLYFKEWNFKYCWTAVRRLFVASILPFNELSHELLGGRGWSGVNTVIKRKWCNERETSS